LSRYICTGLSGTAISDVSLCWRISYFKA